MCECDCPPYVTECRHRDDWRVWFIDWGEDRVFALHGPARLHLTPEGDWEAMPDICHCQVIDDRARAEAEFQRRLVALRALP